MQDRTEYQKANAKDYARRSKEYRARRRALVAEMKDKPCTDCGGRFPAVCMDFDHRDPSEKFLAVSVMVVRGISLKRILAEIDKCDLVCANCHRVRSEKRGHYRR